MKLSGESQAELIKYAIIGLGLYWAYTSIKKEAGEIFDYVKPNATTLMDGLSHPIDALKALIIEPTFSGGAKFTENFDYYIKLNGGVEAYTMAHKNGTFKGAPYDKNIDYKTKYQQKTEPWFSWGNLF